MAVYFHGDAPSADSTVFIGDNTTVYYLPGTTGWSSAFGVRPAVLWNPQVQEDSVSVGRPTALPDPQAQTGGASSGAQPDQFGFIIIGTPNIPVVVEASANLGSSWIPLQSVSLTNGSFYFSDPQWTNFTGRFYRIR